MPNDSTPERYLDNDMRRAIGLAVQILEDMPEWLQPHSNMRDMRDLLAGKSTGRDSLILAQSIATAIVYRSHQIIEGNPSDPDAVVRRLDEFRALFAVAWRTDAWTFTIYYVGMCEMLTRSRTEEAGGDR